MIDHASENPPDGQWGIMLGRIDERTRATNEQVTSMGSKFDTFGTRLGVVESKIETFAPVKRLVFGGVTIILATVLAALLTLVILKP